MTCSNCGAEMDTAEVLNKYHEVIKIDKCSHCGSFLLSQQEIDELDQENVEKIDTPFNNHLEPDDHPLDCPNCHIPMRVITKPDHNNVKVQICHECQGIFLKRGYLSRYFGVQDGSQAELPDNYGLYSSRDRILTGIISSAILLFGVSMVVWRQTGGSLSADEIIASESTPSYLLYLILIGSILIFILGLILSFSRKNHLYRLLGWSSILLSISMVFFLSL